MHCVVCLNTERNSRFMEQLPRTELLPRTVEPGLHWTGGCLTFDYDGEPIHSHMCSFLIVGEDKTLLVDTGHPAHAATVEKTLDDVLGDRKLDYIFPTHTELPHAGNIPRWLAKYPETTIVGQTDDYRLFFPEWFAQGRFKKYEIGESVQLGEDHEFSFLEAIWRDLPNTLWGYDSRSQTIFPADGFAYTHHHNLGECAMLSEERDPPDHKQTVFINERALFWTRYVGMEASFKKIDDMLEKYPARMIAPAHGGVITNLENMVPLLKAGMTSMRMQLKEKPVVGY
jgi:flavorubredoxin